MQTLHPLQQRLLDLSRHARLAEMTLREIGRLVGEAHPQKVKHHLGQLQKKNLLVDTGKRGSSSSNQIQKSNTPEEIYTIPIFGTASCGPATAFADQQVQGYLRISKSRLGPMTHQALRRLFAVRAAGHSMNQANIGGRAIEDGDYVIIDSQTRKPRSGEYVLSVFGDTANIKRLVLLEDHALLVSESDEEIPPFEIGGRDLDYLICGRVSYVVKSLHNSSYTDSAVQ